MADTTAKVTLFGALVALAGPLAAEYALIAVGGMVGAYFAVSFRPSTEMPTMWAALRHAGASFGLAMLTTPLGVVAVEWAAGKWLEQAVSHDLLLAPVAAAIAAGWWPTAKRWAPWIIGGQQPPANKDGAQ